ncbi:NAD(P)/FAD-dependent oxidoreductase [Flavobacterium sp. DG1-102-2]|uniref:phytoene desaturase family protein n=1 Tax=Flavobacterium sp. DG1-102-2 TaxID=3081663 RepID=UPI00294A764F|nr:NAD(P)/FAD-dependent oxidoreductase [Flavobacterium sp. DG1-102-2]MDV6169260.1 NAD(P)/FAD-dependent oxidoreductase [Flavobacterium sp. DG1-102-2]
MEHSRNDLDVIIIGSGAGGLAAALCLARAGKKVLVLEQHYVPGGWCHSFTLGGQRFSPGVHYVGLLNEGQATSDLYKGLGIANDLVFFRMNTKAFEHCVIGDEKFDIPAGLDNFAESLSRSFPESEKEIKKYLTLIQKVNYQMQMMPRLRGVWQIITAPFKTKDFVHNAFFSLKYIINKNVKDSKVRAILNVQCGDHGLPPAKASFIVHSSVMGHYSDGGYYPMGGGSGIVKAMTNAIKRHGGEVRVSADVKKILIENNSAIGVEMADGQKIFAETIISNADPSITYLGLAGRENLSKKLLKRLDKTKYSVTSLILFLTLDMDVTAAGIDSGNTWIFRDDDVDAQFEDLTTGDISEGKEFPAMFVSCTTLKDPVSFNGRYHNFEAVTYIDYDNLQDFKGSEDYHCAEYTAFKEKVIAKFMNTIERVIPGAKQQIVQAELGTPKTNQFYVNSTNGNVYGTEKTLKAVGPFAYKNKSEINNLYLCGASTLSHGVAGATYSGMEAAAKILGCSRDDLMVADDEQKLRIFDADDAGSWPEWVHKKREDKIRHFKEINVSKDKV